MLLFAAILICFGGGGTSHRHAVQQRDKGSQPDESHSRLHQQLPLWGRLTYSVRQKSFLSGARANRSDPASIKEPVKLLKHGLQRLEAWVNNGLVFSVVYKRSH